MKKLMLFILMLSFVAYPAKYYIDFSSGNDAANGTGTGTPWMHCPGDSNATGNASSHSFANNDSMIFKGGIHYQGKIRLKHSNVTYIGNNGWGTGKAVIDGQYSPLYRYAFVDSIAVNNVTINNFEIKKIGGFTMPDSASFPCPTGYPASYGQIQQDYGVSLTLKDSLITIKNCMFDSIGNVYALPPANGNAINGCGIGWVGNPVKLIVDSCEFTGMSTGVAVSFNNPGATVDTALIVMNCDFHTRLVWCCDLNVRCDHAVMGKTFYHDNKFHDFNEYDATNWTGCGEWPHTNGIIVRRDYNYIVQNYPIQYYNNFVYCAEGPNVSGGTAAVFITYGSSITMYNNVLTHARRGRLLYIGWGIRSTESKQFVKIYNNTIYDGGTCLNIMGNAPTLYDTTRRSILVKNNIFINTQSHGFNFCVMEEDTSSSFYPGEIDYNYYSSDGTGPWIHNDYKHGYLTIDAARALGLDSHSIWDTAKIVCQFIDTSFGRDTNSWKNNYRLKATSPMIGTGTNVYSVVSYDKDGNPRPTTAPFDIGAYQYNSYYTVTYNGNNNTGGNVPVDGNTYQNGATVTVLNNAGNLIKSGYSFLNWNTMSDGSGIPYSGTSTFVMGSANIILYAQWQQNKRCTVTIRR